MIIIETVSSCIDGIVLTVEVILLFNTNKSFHKITFSCLQNIAMRSQSVNEGYCLIQLKKIVTISHFSSFKE